MKRTENGEASQYVTCVKNRGISLTAGKRYKVIADAECDKRGWIRVVDDTDEDYCFPASLFKAEQ